MASSSLKDITNPNTNPTVLLQTFDQLQGISETAEQGHLLRDNLDHIEETYSPKQIKMDLPLAKETLVKIPDIIAPLKSYCKVTDSETKYFMTHDRDIKCELTALAKTYPLLEVSLHYSKDTTHMDNVVGSCSKHPPSLPGPFLIQFPNGDVCIPMAGRGNHWVVSIDTTVDYFLIKFYCPSSCGLTKSQYIQFRTDRIQQQEVLQVYDQLRWSDIGIPPPEEARSSKKRQPTNNNNQAQGAKSLKMESPAPEESGGQTVRQTFISWSESLRDDQMLALMNVFNAARN